MAEMDNLTFPQLKVKEIINNLNDYGIRVTPADLQTPTPAVLQALLEQMVVLVFGLDLEEMRNAQLPFAAMQHLSFAELHPNSLPGTLIHLAM